MSVCNQGISSAQTDVGEGEVGRGGGVLWLKVELSRIVRPWLGNPLHLHTHMVFRGRREGADIITVQIRPSTAK